MEFSNTCLLAWCLQSSVARNWLQSQPLLNSETFGILISYPPFIMAIEFTNKYKNFKQYRHTVVDPAGGIFFRL